MWCTRCTSDDYSGWLWCQPLVLLILKFFPQPILIQERKTVCWSEMESITRIVNCLSHVILYWEMAMNVEIVVLKRQKSNESVLDFFMLSQCLYVCHNLCICICIYAGLVMSHHHPDQMYQRSQVFRITLCSLNVFVFVINIRKRISFREVVKKKNGLFTVRLTVRGGRGGSTPLAWS